MADDVDVDRIRIRPISILEESSVRDPLMMISGHAVAKLIKRVAPFVTDPGKLCEIDVQAILIASRIASYGSQMTAKHQCPSCNETSELIVDLNNHIQSFTSFTEEEFSEYDLMLPEAGQSIRLRPIPYEDTIDVTMGLIKASISAEDLEKHNDNVLDAGFIEAYRKQFDQNLTTNLDAITSSIYFVTTKLGKQVHDPLVIKEWLLRLLVVDVTFITKRISDINAKIHEKSIIDYKCDKCDNDNTFYLELDPQKLFMQAESSEIEKSSSAVSKPTTKTTKKQSKTSQRLS